MPLPDSLNFRSGNCSSTMKPVCRNVILPAQSLYWLGQPTTSRDAPGSHYTWNRPQDHDCNLIEEITDTRSRTTWAGRFKYLPEEREIYSLCQMNGSDHECQHDHDKEEDSNQRVPQGSMRHRHIADLLVNHPFIPTKVVHLEIQQPDSIRLAGLTVLWNDVSRRQLLVRSSP